MAIQRGLNLFLCLCLALAPVAPAHAAAKSGLELATAENAFLRDLVERTKTFIYMNWANINGTYMCLTDNSADQVKCDSRLKHVRSEIALHYPKLRQHQILYHLFDHSNFSILMVNLWMQVAQKYAGTSVVLFTKLDDFNLEHPLDFTLHSEDVPSAPWQPAEIEAGLNGLISQGEADLNGFNHYFRNLCAEVFSKRSEKETLAAYLNICEKIELKYDAKKQAFYFSLPDALPEDVRTAFNLFRTYSADPAISIAKKFKAKFLGLIQISPYVGLVHSSEPTRADLTHAFKTMLKPARKIITEFDGHLPFYQTSTPPQERSSAGRWKWLNLMGYKPIAKQLTANPGQRMKVMPSFAFEDLREELDSEYETNQLIKMGGQLAAVLAVNVAVCWGGGRLIGLVAKTVRFLPGFKALCYPMVTIPINIGYMIESMHDFSNKYQEVFASQSGQQLLREIETLSSEETFVVISALMLPLGTGKALAYLGTKGVKLSKTSFEHLKHSVTRLQAMP